MSSPPPPLPFRNSRRRFFVTAVDLCALGNGVRRASGNSKGDPSCFGSHQNLKLRQYALRLFFLLFHPGLTLYEQFLTYCNSPLLPPPPPPPSPPPLLLLVLPAGAACRCWCCLLLVLLLVLVCCGWFALMLYWCSCVRGRRCPCSRPLETSSSTSKGGMKLTPMPAS